MSAGTIVRLSCPDNLKSLVQVFRKLSYRYLWDSSFREARECWMRGERKGAVCEKRIQTIYLE